MRKKNFIRLQTNYNAMGLSPKSRHLLESKQRALIQHRVNVLRNWERSAKTPRDETLAMFFEQMIHKYIPQVAEKEVDKETGGGTLEEEEERDEDDSVEGTTNVTINDPGIVEAEKENVDPSTNKDGNDNHNIKNKPRTRTRQVTGPPKRQTCQKTSASATGTTQTRDKETNQGAKKTAELTEKETREEGANLIGSMLYLAGGSSTANSGEMGNQN